MFCIFFKFQARIERYCMCDTAARGAGMRINDGAAGQYAVAVLVHGGMLMLSLLCRMPDHTR